MAKKTSRNGSSGKRELILRAATRVFARNGYFSSKVADIARAADVADGTVYLYFKSKEEILHSIFDQNMAEAIAACRKLIENSRDPREKLRRIATLHLERLGADRDLAGVFRKDLNAKVVSKILFGALDEMATNWIISKRSYKLEPMAEIVMDVFLSGVS